MLAHVQQMKLTFDTDVFRKMKNCVVCLRKGFLNPGGCVKDGLGEDGKLKLLGYAVCLFACRLEEIVETKRSRDEAAAIVDELGYECDASSEDLENLDGFSLTEEDGQDSRPEKLKDCFGILPGAAEIVLREVTISRTFAEA